MIENENEFVSMLSYRVDEALADMKAKGVNDADALGKLTSFFIICLNKKGVSPRTIRICLNEFEKIQYAKKNN